MEKITNKLSESVYLNSLLKVLKRRDDDSRYAMPCYFVTKGILFYLLGKENFFINIVSKRFVNDEVYDDVSFLFRVKNKKLHLCDISFEADLSEAVIVFSGVTVYESRSEVESREDFVYRLEHVGIFRIINSYMAKHSQYPGKSLKHMDAIFFNELTEIRKINQYKINFEKDYQYDKKSADILGCSQNNKSLLFIKHIFCSTVMHQYAKYNSTFIYKSISGNRGEAVLQDEQADDMAAILQ